MAIVDFETTNKLPLKVCNTPIMIDFWVSGTCNMRCSYCLHGLSNTDSLRKGIVQGQLSWDNFLRVADGMSEFDKPIMGASFCGIGEPLTHPLLPQMISHLKQNRLVSIVELTTNALLLTEERATELIDAGVDYLSVSIQGVNEEAYKRTCGVPFDPHVIAQRLEWYKEHRRPGTLLVVRTLDIALHGEEDEREFHQIFDPVADQTFIANAVKLYKGMDYSELIPVEKDQFGRGARVYAPACPLVFSTLHIRPDGDIAICPLPVCPAILGNVSTVTLREAWESKARYEVMYSHACERREEYDACDGCTQPDMLCPGIGPSPSLKYVIRSRMHM